MNAKNGFWLSAALLLGLFVGTQPLPVAVVAGTLLALGLLSLLTPLAALMGLLILAPARTLIATEAAFQLPLDIGQLALLVFIAFMGLHRVILPRAPLRLHKSAVYLPLILFLIVTGLSAFNAFSLSAWLSEWLKWVQMLLLAVIVVSFFPAYQWRWLVFGLVMAGLANALIGLYEFLGGSGALHLLINDRFFRAFGTFGQPNPFGGFMGLLAPLALMAALGYGRRWWLSRSHSDAAAALFYAGSFAILAMGVVISWSRGAWMAFLAAALVMLVALPHKIWRGAGLAAGLIVIVLWLWTAGLLPASITARISSSTEEFFAFEDVRGVDITPANYPVVERLAHWQAALNMARSHPWLGVGFGNYEVAYPAYRLINWDEPLGHAHNYYLNMLAENGIIGFLGYGKVWLLIMWLNWRARQHPDILSRFVGVGLIGTWTYLAVHSLFDSLYVNNLFLHIGLMLGILGVLYNQVINRVNLRIA